MSYVTAEASLSLADMFFYEIRITVDVIASSFQIDLTRCKPSLKNLNSLMDL